MKTKSTIGAQISALLGHIPASIHFSCGMTGERRDLDQSTEIKGIHIGSGVDQITGQEMHSPALIEFEDGQFSVTTKGALAAGNAGVRMTKAELNMLATKHLIGQGCKITGPDGKLIAF
jgi:hypothetical protein